MSRDSVIITNEFTPLLTRRRFILDAFSHMALVSSGSSIIHNSIDFANYLMWYISRQFGI